MKDLRKKINNMLIIGVKVFASLWLFSNNLISFSSYFFRFYINFSFLTPDRYQQWKDHHVSYSPMYQCCFVNFVYFKPGSRVIIKKWFLGVTDSTHAFFAKKFSFFCWLTSSPSFCPSSILISPTLFTSWLPSRINGMVRMLGCSLNIVFFLKMYFFWTPSDLRVTDLRSAVQRTDTDIEATVHSTYIDGPRAQNKNQYLWECSIFNLHTAAGDGTFPFTRMFTLF